MKWYAKATGDMTLSVLDENDMQILKVDMLKANTLQAGADGAILCRTMNDLTVIAGFAEGADTLSEEELPFSGEGLSPFPWSVQYNEAKRRITVRSSKKIIADKDYPKRVPDHVIQEILGCLEKGIDKVNRNGSD